MKRVNIEIEIEGEILATSELEARKAVSQELLSEIPWVVTHSTDIEVLHPIFFNTLDVWYEGGEDIDEDEEEVDMDFYASVGVNALVDGKQRLFLLEGALTTILQNSDLIQGNVGSVFVTISEINF